MIYLFDTFVALSKTNPDQALGIGIGIIVGMGIISTLIYNVVDRLCETIVALRRK